MPTSFTPQVNPEKVFAKLRLKGRKPGLLGQIWLAVKRNSSLAINTQPEKARVSFEENLRGTRSHTNRMTIDLVIPDRYVFPVNRSLNAHPVKISLIQQKARRWGITSHDVVDGIERTFSLRH